MNVAERSTKQNVDLFGTPSPVCFVTGSVSPRVGRVVAECFHSRGFQVVLHGRSANQGKSQTDSELASLTVQGNVQDEANVTAWLDRTKTELGRIDCLVNCAAIWEPKTLEETTAEDFKRYFEVNTLGSALLCQHFGLAMAKQPTGGAIINIGDWAVRRPYRDFAAYFVSKGSTRCLTETMAIELASRNPRVRVSAVLPGPVLMAETISPEREAEIANQALLKRAGTAQDVAEAVYFLAMSPFITGVSLPVDGGRSISAGPASDIAHPDVEA